MKGLLYVVPSVVVSMCVGCDSVGEYLVTELLIKSVDFDAILQIVSDVITGASQ